MRSRTKKQFSSSWKAYRRLTMKGWSICGRGRRYWGESRERGTDGRGKRSSAGTWTECTKLEQDKEEWRGDEADLLEQPALLNDVRDRLHFHTFRFVDVLERIQVLRLFMLNDANLLRQNNQPSNQVRQRKEKSVGNASCDPTRDVPFQRHPCRRI